MRLRLHLGKAREYWREDRLDLANAAVTIWLLLSQPLPVFLFARTLVSLTFTGAAIAVSTLYFKRSMRRHGMLVTA